MSPCWEFACLDTDQWPASHIHLRLTRKHLNFCDVIVDNLWWYIHALIPDDSVAIMMAFQLPGVQVLGLTTIFGNCATEHATRNALILASSIRYIFMTNLPLFHFVPSSLLTLAILLHLDSGMLTVREGRPSRGSSSRGQPWASQGIAHATYFAICSSISSEQL